MNSRDDIDARALIAALNGEASAEQADALARWRAGAPENEARFRALEEIWAAAGDAEDAFAVGAPPSAAAVIRAAEAAEAPRLRQGAAGGAAALRRVTARSRPPVGARRLLRPLGWSAVAAALVGIGIGIAEYRGTLADRPLTAAHEVVTGPGEVATVTLPDGTLIRLGGRTRLTVDPAARGEPVTLEGRAYFVVPPRRRPASPFTVRTPAGEATVLGTRFDLEARAGEMEVVVVDGEVEVTASGERVRVGASEVARVRPGAAPVVEEASDVFGLTEWLGAFVAFDATPLARVAAEFERRLGVRIEIADPELAARTVTGWFTDQGSTDKVAAICRAVGARCTVRGDTVYMARREAMSGTR